MPSPSLDELAERARGLQLSGGRVLIGIVGAPGSGKSTLAAKLVRRLNLAGVETGHVPMDGFHLPNAELDARGLRDAKGAPHTFDVEAYAALLRRLREAGSDVTAPDFDRGADEPVPDSIVVPASATVVVTEGNYLLDTGGAWSQVRGLLDEVWFVDLDENRRRARLVDRHVAFGRSREAAQEWVDRVDQPNADRVITRRDAADLIVEIGP